MIKNSLKLKLFINISFLVSLTLLITSAVSFVAARNEIREVLDADMAESAKLILKIAKYNPNQNFLLEKNEEIEEKIFHKFEKEIHLQVWKKDKLIHDSDKGFFIEKPQDEGYSNLEINGEKWRKFCLRDDKSNLTILILERDKVRHQLILQILASLFIPLIFSFPAILIVIWSSIKSRLEGFSKLSYEIEKISANTLLPFSNQDLPVEVEPLINSLNIMIARLDDAMESERRFTNYAAHELRTPLAAIKAQTQLLLRNKDQEKAAEYLQDLVKGVDRMTHLINQILVLSRLEPENNNITKEKIDLVALMNNLLKEHHDLIDKKHLKILFNFKGEFIIFGNKTYFEIMLNNLLDNALKYSVADKEIIVDFEEGEEEIILRITNFGEEISADEIGKLFEKFYRARGNQVVGCGLGLAIVKKIIELHGGVVKFFSVQENGLGKNMVELRLLRVK